MSLEGSAMCISLATLYLFISVECGQPMLRIPRIVCPQKHKLF